MILPARIVPAAARGEAGHVLQRQHRRAFQHAHAIAPQAERQALDVGGRLDHDRAGCMHAACVVRTARDPGEIVAVQFGAGFTQLAQMGRVAGQRQAALGASRVDLAAPDHDALLEVVIGRRRQGRNRWQGGSRASSAGRHGLHRRSRRSQVVGDVDHETGIAPGGALPDAQGLQHDDAGAGLVQPQRAPPQACVARSDHQEITGLVPFQAGKQALRAETGVPGAETRFAGQPSRRRSCAVPLAAHRARGVTTDRPDRRRIRGRRVRSVA